MMHLSLTLGAQVSGPHGCSCCSPGAVFPLDLLTPWVQRSIISSKKLPSPLRLVFSLISDQPFFSLVLIASRSQSPNHCTSLFPFERSPGPDSSQITEGFVLLWPEYWTCHWAALTLRQQRPGCGSVTLLGSFRHSRFWILI